jgi:hypothetical protein
MSTPSTDPPRSWPKHLSKADYARACQEVTGKPVSRQAISRRIERGTLQVTTVTIAGQVREYIDTEKFPPGPGQPRWANRPTPSPQQ